MRPSVIGRSERYWKCVAGAGSSQSRTTPGATRRGRRTRRESGALAQRRAPDARIHVARFDDLDLAESSFDVAYGMSAPHPRLEAPFAREASVAKLHHRLSQKDSHESDDPLGRDKETAAPGTGGSCSTPARSP